MPRVQPYILTWPMHILHESQVIFLFPHSPPRQLFHVVYDVKQELF